MSKRRGNYLAYLRGMGFDLSEHIPFTKRYRARCSTCETFADSALRRVYGKTWDSMDADRKRVILRDYQEAWDDERLSPEEYRRRIGPALKSYGDVMLVREKQGWK